MMVLVLVTSPETDIRCMFEMQKSLAAPNASFNITQYVMQHIVYLNTKIPALWQPSILVPDPRKRDYSYYPAEHSVSQTRW